ncbi:MAG: MMPL family transporter [Archangium sp.]
MKPEWVKRIIFIWTLLGAGIVLHQIKLWSGGIPIETDLLSLLPTEGRDQTAEDVLKHLGDSASRSVVVLVTSKDKTTSIDAAHKFAFAINLPQKLERITPPPPGANTLLEELAPWREYLLTPEQQQRLAQSSTTDLTDLAMQQLQQPVGARYGDFREDPLQLFTEYLVARAKITKLRPEGDLLVFESEQGHHALLRYRTIGGAFSLDGNSPIADALEKGRAAAASTGVELTFAGVPLFAEAAASRANTEVSTVGFGSLAAILIIMFLAFRSPRPLILVTLSVGMGAAAGLSACVLVFGKVHLMTLVFGASLVGVAEDYGIHYFASRQAHPKKEARELLNHLTPGLFLAMITSVAGYVVLGLAPFPGIRQLALFSSVGLLAAFVTVLAWFPIFDRGIVKPTRFGQVWANTRRWWPSLSAPALIVVLLLTAALGYVTWNKLTVRDDIRALQGSPQSLIDAQKKVGEAVGLPSPGQFFIVRGADEGERLEREEALAAKLDELKRKNVLGGYDALSNWVPSPSKQLERQKLFRSTRAAILAALKDELENPEPHEFDAKPLTLADAQKLQIGEALTPLIMKDAHVVLLHSPSKDALDQYAALDALPGVKFVDRTGDISALMARWRVGMSWLLLGGFALIFFVLWWRFRSRAWRAFVPTIISTVVALAAVAWLGEPLTLFHVLSLWLLLGMGEDYGIFLVEHPQEQGEAWLAIGLGAISTLLSFGLLAVSQTPAIHAFGITLGVGITTVWLISPLFAPKPEAADAAAKPAERTPGPPPA